MKALAVAIFLCGILRYKNIKIETIVTVAVIFYIFGVIWENCYPVIFHNEYPVYYSRSGLFNGFLFVAIGALFADKKIRINKKIVWIGLIISAILWAAECALNAIFSVTTYIFLVPLVMSIFYLLLTAKLNINTKSIGSMSSIVYYIHIIVGGVSLGLIELLLGVKVWKPLQWIIIGVVSYAIAFLVIRLQKLKGFKWLKHFFY